MKKFTKINKEMAEIPRLPRVCPGEAPSEQADFKKDLINSPTGLAPTPECHVREDVEWHSGSGFRPPGERRNHKENPRAVKPWIFTMNNYSNKSIRHNLAQAPLEIPQSARKSFHNNHRRSSIFARDRRPASKVLLIKSISLTGQAALEVAILGSLILVVLSTLLTYGQRFDAQQDMKMEAFRKALNRSYARNAAVSYTLNKDKRYYNLMAGYGEGQPSRLSASASVMWQKGAAGCREGTEVGGKTCKNSREDKTAQSSFAYYEINNQLIGREDPDVFGDDIMIPRYPKLTKSYTEEDDDEGTTMKVPAGVWQEVSRRKTNQTSKSTKQERPGTTSTIDNSQQLTLNENVYTKASLRYDRATTNATREDIHVPVYVYEGGGYSYGGNDYIIMTPPEARQGAYYNSQNNRIEYDPEVREDAAVTKNRNWRTIF
ncbi:MAG: hypothetical protein FJZ10_05300 [Candidatus Omnitrophica bacterium]|nr:hypothetical protein [Candidatus Omnitrophota bacterium]